MGYNADLESRNEDSVEGMDSNETVSPLLPRPRPRRATTASDIAHRRRYSSNLMVSL
jgi:hypothetical protein